MRLLPLAIALASWALAAGPAEGPPPPEFTAALKNFQSDAPRGWSFVQTTVAEGKSLVERSDAARPEFDRWSLLEKDGRTPQPGELKDYADARSRRSRSGTAPRITEQFNLATVEVLNETLERVTYRCALRPGEARDNVAAFLRATTIVHKPTQTIESLKISNTGEFNPTIGVKITEMKTVMTYSRPTAETPSLPQIVTTRVRGRAFWMKSFDEEMTVTFSDYVFVGKR
ncbi:MAG: hypothetical protein EXS38_07795 [Opitutus sp.]|nr:hypothetical protein [Opitutus sp.]